jgi:hypothetical protein
MKGKGFFLFHFKEFEGNLKRGNFKLNFEITSKGIREGNQRVEIP